VKGVKAAEPSVRFAWLARAIGIGMARYARLLAATSRASGTLTDEQVVLVFWHEYNLVALVVMLMRRRGHRHVSFSTRGFRGIVISTMLARLGVRAIPLPDQGRDRAESRALTLAMARLAAEGYSPAVTPDGPFGPYRVAKPGAAIVARAAALPIVPLAFRIRPQVRLRRRWDRHLVPLPFGRIRIVEGEPLRLGQRDALRSHIAAIDAELKRVSRVADGADR
jgi:lysophospholipid acyltransferase (LPLAT)-like uncharacterized protein